MASPQLPKDENRCQEEATAESGGQGWEGAWTAASLWLSTARLAPWVLSS